MSLVEPTGLSELIHGSLFGHPLMLFTTQRSGARAGDILPVTLDSERDAVRRRITAPPVIARLSDQNDQRTPAL